VSYKAGVKGRNIKRGRYDMKRDHRLFLRDIIDAMDAIENFVESYYTIEYYKNLPSYHNDRKLNCV